MYRVAQTTVFLYTLTSYALTSSNIDRFSNLSIFDKVRAYETKYANFGGHV